MTLLAIATGGAIGASLRYLSVAAAARAFGPGFPVGTMGVNVAGSFLMGAVVTVLVARGSAGGALGPFLTTGLLGGFTTFSAFSLDAVNLIEEGRALAAIAYVGLSVGLSVLALACGMILARSVFP